MSANHKFIKTLIEKYHSSKKSISIVDYGCGNGDLLSFIDTKKLSRYVGFEVSDDCLKVARNTHDKKFIFKKIDSKKSIQLGKNNTVDLLILIGVIQYMSNKEIVNLLKEAKKVLKKDGQIIISCAVDHVPYKFLNLYRLFLPNNYIVRKKIISQFSKFGFTPIFAQEKGIFIAPFFSNIASFFFDSFDRLILHNRGKIGLFGSLARKIIEPLIRLEYLIPIDYGYTLYLVFEKKK